VSNAPHLIDVHVPREPSGVVLVLHGGAGRQETTMVSPTQLSVLRMIPIARRIARAGRGRLAVFRLLNTHRGWNTTHTPVHDARWALEQIATRLGAGLPTCLVGHSLGGRAAHLSAGRPGVHSVVALAPWVYPTDIPPGLTDQRLLVVHGSRDRIASPSRSAELARAIGARYVCVEGGTHSMLRHYREFHGLAARWATSTL
jgi:pimeloyl-ACP methyl ester carboxylesterase